MKKVVLTSILFIFILSVYSQNKQEYYVRVKPNKSITPTEKIINANGTLSLTFTNNNLQNFFNSKVVYEYSKPFETSNSNHLQRIYKVILEDDSYVNDLLNLEEVENVALKSEGIPLYEPNDYLEGNGEPNRALELVHASEAFDLVQGDPNILVGIVDTGFETTHDELTNKIVENFDDNNGNLSHGTKVAGYVAGDTDNGIGISSIGFNTKIVTAANGVTPEQMWQIAQYPGVRVINGSWYNGCIYDEDDAEIFREIWEDFGVVVVFAAGNGTQCGGPTNYLYPQSYDHVIQVSSVGTSFPYGTTHPVYGQIEWMDSHVNGGVYDGTNSHHHHDKVDIVAPGYAVPGGISVNNSYGKGWGTSFASPQVAGACALILDANPNLTPDEVRNILLSSTDDIYNLPINQQFTGLLGTGRLNVYRAVKTAKCLFDNDPNPQLDLYLRNSSSDLAVEPDEETGNVMWQSNDIWVRNQPDGIYVKEHQNPEYDPNNPNYVYVRVRNTSCVTSSGNDELKLYWSKANTSLAWPQHWDGSLFIDGVSMGNEIATLNIPVLKPGQETIIQYEWNVPNPDDYIDINPNPWHFCLLSRIISNDDPMTSTEVSSIWLNVKNNNNIAWKNTTVVDIVPDLSNKVGGVVAVGNPFNESRTFRLELIREQNELGKAIYNEAEIGVKMDDVLFDAWERGGKNSLKLKATNEEQKNIVTDNNVIIDNIQFEPNEIGTLYLTFNFLTKELTDKDKFIYHVIQRDVITNEIIGGETYEIRKKPREIFSADAGNDKEIDKNEAVTISAEEINEAAIYNWYDEDGNLIYTGKDLTVSPNVTKKYKLEIITDIDGYKDYDEIEVKVNPYSLQSLLPNPASNQVSVNYKAQGSSSAYIMITSTTNGTSNNYILNQNELETSIDISSYPQGIYGVALVCDGVIVDAKNLIIE